jgi:hypothetical protein
MAPEITASYAYDVFLSKRRLPFSIKSAKFTKRIPEKYMAYLF